MLHNRFTRTILMALFTTTIIFQSCLKDSHTKTYAIFSPVYKSVAEVRAGIKNNVASAISKPGKIFVQGNYIFLNEVDKGVHIIDNTNPAAPVNKYFVSIPGNLDMAVKGNILYADQYRDLLAIDITDPNKIEVKKIIDNVFPSRQYSAGFFNDTTRIIVDWVRKDTTVDVNLNFYNYSGGVVFDRAFASSLSASSAPAVGVSGSMARFTLLNNYLYIVTNKDLKVFNISEPKNPVYSNNVTIGNNIETIYPFKNNLFIGSQTGMFVYNTTNPAQPAKVSVFNHATVCDPVIADDQYAYVTLRSGTNCNGNINRLDILNISNLASPVFVRSFNLTNPHGLSKSGNTLMICDGTAGLKIFDATSVTNLKLLQTITGPETFDVIMLNGNAVVVAKDGLYQYNYSNLSNVTLTSKINY
jgi:hypothetical protein